MRKADGMEFRRILKEICADSCEDESIALLFSGGTDSLTVLWTLLDLGMKPTCYVFQLPKIESRDVRVSSLAAAEFGVELKRVKPPVEQTLSELARDLGEVVRLIGSGRKTHVEVLWGYWHLLRAVEEQKVFTGLQADTLYGSSRSMAIRHGKQAAAEFAAARRKLIDEPGQEGLSQAHSLASHFGKDLVSPYTDERMRAWMMRWSWRELNRPKQKMPAVWGFEVEFKRCGLYRRNDNMQCGSGVREYLARLMDDAGINPLGWRSPARLYAELGKIA